MKSLPNWMKTLIPVLIGIAVMVYLFGFALTFSDSTKPATLVSIDQERRSATVELEEGALTELPWSDIAELNPERESTRSFVGREAQATGQQISVVRAGLISQFQRLSLGLIAAVLGLIGAVLALQSWRLKIIAKILGYRVSFLQAGQCMMIGLFYGNVIPAGQIGGDPIKAIYLARMVDAPASKMLAAVFIDRVLGLLAIVGIAGIALLPHIGDTRYAYAGVAIGVVLAIGGSAMLLILSRRLRRLSGVDWLVGKLPGSPVERFVEAFADVRSQPALLVTSVALSFVAQLGLGLAALLTGIYLAIPFEQAGALDYFGTVPVINVVTSVPGSPPGGWGYGEGAYMLFFGFYGVPAEQAVVLSVVPRLGMLLFSLLGLPAIIAARKRFGGIGKAEVAEKTEAPQASQDAAGA